MGKETVQLIAQEYLCNTCGACSAVCPVDAIRFEETVGGYVFPIVHEDPCLQCGRCMEVCPGVYFGETLMEQLPGDPFVGDIRECCVGRAVDPDVFANAQSGGVVTALLLYALDVGLIDGAIVTMMKPGPRPRPQATLATTREDIVAAQGSKYSPVPLLRTLKTLPSTRLEVAVVGLPCHMHGLLNLIDLEPALAERVKLKIGLVCDRVMTAAAIDFLIARARIEDGVEMLAFRDKTAGGYPGSVRVAGSAGSNVILSPRIRLSIKDALTPARCRLCFDKMNVFSDVTVGDPWGVAGADMVKGESVVVIRSQIGIELVACAIDAGVLALRHVNCEEALAGQHIDDRRASWRGYCDAWEDMGFETPNFYHRIARAASPQGDQPYRLQLERARSLNDFDSRAQLLSHVHRVSLQRGMAQRIRFVYTHAGRAIRAARGKLTRAFRSLSKTIRRTEDDC